MNAVSAEVDRPRINADETDLNRLQSSSLPGFSDRSYPRLAAAIYFALQQSQVARAISAITLSRTT
jgi:hypothetical protein